MCLTNSSWRAAFAFLAPLLCTPAAAQPAARVFGPGCEPLPAASVTAFSLEVDGTKPVSHQQPVAANARLLVMVRERGIDSRLELADPARRQSRSMDSPLRRWGPQRVVVEPAQARVIRVTVVGKERVRGTAEVQVFSVGNADTACLAMHRLLAAGDEHHSRALRISAGELPSQPGAVRREHEAAIRNYEEAARKPASGVASTPKAQAVMSAAAAFYQGVQGYSQARETAQRAEAEFGHIADDYGIDRARAMRAAALIEIALDTSKGPGTPEEKQRRTRDMLAAARTLLAQAAAGFESRREPFDQALALNNIGISFFKEQRYDEAIAAYQRPLALYERLGERTRQGQVLQNIALAQSDVGRYEGARSSYQRALALIDKAGNPKLAAETLNNLGLCEQKTGRPDEALQHYSEALEIHTRLQNDGGRARSLHGIGATYRDIGNLSEAFNYFTRALEIRRSVFDPPGRLASLRGLADIHRDSGDIAAAIAQREEALSLTATPGMRMLLLVDLVRDAMLGGYRDKAARYLDEIFANDAGGDPVLYARALLERARYNLGGLALEPAAGDAREARQLFRAQQLSSAVFSSLVLESKIACARGDLTAAEAKAGDALDLAETLRKSSSNPTLRATLWPSLRPAFDLRIDLLAQSRPCGVPRRPNERLALEMAERARGRALEDFRAMAAHDGVAALPEEKQRSELFESLAELRTRIEALSEAAGANEEVLVDLRNQAAELARQIDMMDARIGEKRARDKQATPASRPDAEMIPAGVAVVEYWVGEKNAYAWLVTRDQLRMFELGSSIRIEEVSRAFHESMRAITTIDALERARRNSDLARLILDPLLPHLARTERIYFVPDGSLHAVPFAALEFREAGKVRALIDEFDVAVASAIRSLGHSRVAQGSAELRALIVADPVYTRDDPRFGGTRLADVASRAPTLRGGRGYAGGSRAWQPLPASKREAAAIAALMPAASVRMLSGFEATREALLEQDLGRFRILHFATHAIADTEAPQLSALILSTWTVEGKSTSGEVFAGDILLRRLDADLVVLSACDTAMGRSSAGEGLLGLRYAAHAGGARNVVATLWPVVDTVGASVMTGMYAAIINDKKDSVAALSQAMRAARDKWKDPALWAVYQVSTAQVRSTLH